jgi:hypothetical protein
MIPRKRAHKPKIIFDPSEDRYPDDASDEEPPAKAPKAKAPTAMAPMKTIAKQVADPACVMTSRCPLHAHCLVPIPVFPPAWLYLHRKLW